MKIGDLVRMKSNHKATRNPGIVVKVYDYRFDHEQDEGSKYRPMASVHWPHLERAKPMQHRQDMLEVISGARN